MATLAILPVKSFSHAKQRLRHEVPPQLRQALAEAMLLDVLGALARCRTLAGVLVISPSDHAREVAVGCGARALADTGEGHNAAALLGLCLATQEGMARALLVPGDCPALDPAEVDELVARPHPSQGVLIVPDRHGTGTNALLLTPPGALEPSFGPGSCARHQDHARRQGVDSEVVQVSSLALDVDTPEDLDSLAALAERAPRTFELLSRC